MEDREREYLGEIKISDDVVSICCINAAVKTEGVHELSGGFMGNLQKNLRGSQSPFSGIKINREDDSVTVDVSIIVDFNVKIPQVAWEVQVNVKNDIEEMTGLKVKAVNIHVQGVHIEGREDEND